MTSASKLTPREAERALEKHLNSLFWTTAINNQLAVRLTTVVHEWLNENYPHGKLIRVTSDGSTVSVFINWAPEDAVVFDAADYPAPRPATVVSHHELNLLRNPNFVRALQQAESVIEELIEREIRAAVTAKEELSETLSETLPETYVDADLGTGVNTGVNIWLRSDVAHELRALLGNAYPQLSRALSTLYTQLGA